MKINSDYRDLLKSLNAAKVRYLIVGGYAVMVHAEPYYTKDLDIWIDRSQSNAEAVFRALREFGAPLREIGVQDFTEPDVFYQVGIEPVRVDVMTSVAGLDFDPAWARRKVVDFDGELAAALSLEDLITSKEAAGRATDRQHLRRLRKKS
jgi:predicted nucleotidyltransferase